MSLKGTFAPVSVKELLAICRGEVSGSQGPTSAWILTLTVTDNRFNFSFFVRILQHRKPCAIYTHAQTDSN